MDPESCANSTRPSPLRVAVIGNSNSIMRASYAWILHGHADLIVTNRSIGASPSVVLLDFLARETNFEYDFIIVETAVVDYLQEATYPRERSQETLELFVRYVRAKCAAEVIILTIPTRPALLAPELHWQESLYREVAARLNVPILDGFRLIRSLIGQPKMARVDLFRTRAERLVSAFRLPGGLYIYLAWRSLRDRNFRDNSLGIFSFSDHVHFTGSMYALVSTLLRQFMCSRSSFRSDDQTHASPSTPPILLAIQPLGGSLVTRASSLISRELVSLSSSGIAHYRCPPGYRVYGIMVNAAKISGLLHLRSAAGNTKLTLRSSPLPSEWIAMVVPIVDLVGDGDIEATITPGTVPELSAGEAELGELILVRIDWRDVVPDSSKETNDSCEIGGAPWAETLIADAASRADAATREIETIGEIVDRDCLALATKMMAANATAFSYAERARVMLILGMTDGLSGFLDTACSEQPGNAELEEMRAGWLAVTAEDSMQPTALLTRAMGLAGDGAIDEADILLAEGMARFTGRVEFYRESALNATRKKDWPEALRRWSLVQTRFPHGPDAYIWQAFVLREMGRFDDAASLLAAAVNRFPDHSGAVIEQAWLANRRRSWATAADCWESVLRKYPDHPAGYLGGAEAYRELGRIEDAEALLRLGRARLPKDHSIALNWGELATRQHDWPEAARRWLLLREAFPTDKRCVQEAARALANAGQEAQADALLREALAEFPDDLKLNFQWAEFADRIEDWAVSAERWDHVRKRFAKEKRGHQHAMRARLRLGELAHAEQVCHDAVELFPNDIDILVQAGIVALQAGALAVAAERFAAAHTLDRHHVEAMKWHSDVQSRLGSVAAITPVETSA
jgi:tetratricopeptide (TPR) repeat protein